MFMSLCARLVWNAVRGLTLQQKKGGEPPKLKRSRYACLRRWNTRLEAQRMLLILEFGYAGSRRGQ